MISNHGFHRDHLKTRILLALCSESKEYSCIQVVTTETCCFWERKSRTKRVSLSLSPSLPLPSTRSLKSSCARKNKSTCNEWSFTHTDTHTHTKLFKVSHSRTSLIHSLFHGNSGQAMPTAHVGCSLNKSSV